jgi:hypothetical protein
VLAPTIAAVTLTLGRASQAGDKQPVAAAATPKERQWTSV